MRRMVAILFATALVSVSGATACSGIQEDLQKRAQEEVEKGRKQVEQKVQERQKRIEEEVKKGQQQVKEN
jgi:vacuolar-type H+-ATPase subunit E/Vma4